MIPSQIVAEREPAASTEEMRQSHENIKKRLARRKKDEL
jgi:hypothetical protein